MMDVDISPSNRYAAAYTNNSQIIIVDNLTNEYKVKESPFLVSYKGSWNINKYLHNCCCCCSGGSERTGDVGWLCHCPLQPGLGSAGHWGSGADKELWAGPHDDCQDRGQKHQTCQHYQEQIRMSRDSNNDCVICTFTFDFTISKAMILITVSQEWWLCWLWQWTCSKTCHQVLWKGVLTKLSHSFCL